jgi:hypothetical protein
MFVHRRRADAHAAGTHGFSNPVVTSTTSAIVVG